MKVDDIEGSKVGSKNRINKFQSAYDTNLNVHDVPGAIVGSLKKGIVTQRNTNPINPNYKYIGDSDIGPTNINNPYGRKEQTDAASEIANNKEKIEEPTSSKNQIKPKTERTKLTPPEPRVTDDQAFTEYLNNAK